jgi:D-lactate dehydrogenase
MKHKIVFFDIEPYEKKFLQKELKNQELVFINKESHNTDLSKIKDASIISGFVSSSIDKKIIDNFPKLKAIVTRSTGFDNIDIKECKKRNIIVQNVPTYGENTVAEHCFALILALSRKIVQAAEKSKLDFSPEGLTGFDLKGKTLGIVGLGNIGQNVARIARGFEMNVIYYELKPNQEMEKKLGVKYSGTINNLYAQSDIITFHVPLCKSTTHLFNKSSLKKLKNPTYIINTSRGPIIDTTALIDGLNSGIIAGAGLDVLEEETLIKEEKQLTHYKFNRDELNSLFENHLLMKYPNVIITPHNAFNSNEALERIIKTTAENIKSIIKGNPINIIK